MRGVRTEKRERGEEGVINANMLGMPREVMALKGLLIQLQ